MSVNFLLVKVFLLVHRVRCAGVLTLLDSQGFGSLCCQNVPLPVYCYKCSFVLLSFVVVYLIYFYLSLYTRSSVLWPFNGFNFMFWFLQL